jgi:hypothetical protein
LHLIGDGKETVQNAEGVHRLGEESYRCDRLPATAQKGPHCFVESGFLSAFRKQSCKVHLEISKPGISAHRESAARPGWALGKHAEDEVTARAQEPNRQRQQKLWMAQYVVIFAFRQVKPTVPSICSV